MGHSHGATHQPVPNFRARLLGIAAASLALVIAVALVALWPRGDLSDRVGELGYPSEIYAAEVTAVERGACERSSPGTSDVTCIVAELRLLQGPDRGDTTFLEFVAGTPTTPDIDDGDRLVLSYTAEAEPGFQYAFADRDRRPVLWALAAVFAVAVVLLGRLRGVAALAGLAATFVLLLAFVLPAILGGSSPLLVAVVGAAAIAYLALYLAHGFRPMTHVALLGTLASLGVTILFANVFVAIARFSGFASEEAIFLNVADSEIQLTGLVLGGIVIGALGAIDDMTVTQASVTWELRAANPELGRARLFAAAMRIGRDHVASTVNTLALAYAGASMPLLILFVLARQSVGTVANGEVVATEIVRTLVGSIGLVASVPLTTWLAVATVEAGTGTRTRRARRNRGPDDPFDQEDDQEW